MRHGKMRKPARRALALLFALALLWETGALTPKAADVIAADGTVSFVMWQRINTVKKLKEICSDGPHPMLISYKSNKTEYFMCVTKDNWTWQKNDFVLTGMPSVYDSRFDDMRDAWKNLSYFVTLGTYNTPWAQYKGADSNDNPKMVFQVSDGHDGPGEYLGPGKSYEGQTYGGHKVRDTCFVVRPEETTTWRFSNWGDGVSDGFRMWNRDYDGDAEDVIFHGSVIVLSDDDREEIESVCVGTAVSVSALTHDFTVLNDQATTMGRPISYIPEGVTLRVANGGVLTVDGVLINDGKIVVEEGGLLVVRAASLIAPYHIKKANCGGFSSAGTVVVEKKGLIYGGGVNGIYLTGGLVYNFGGIAAENFTAARKRLINNQAGAWVAAGRTLRTDYHFYGLDEFFRYGKNAAYNSIFFVTRCSFCNLPYGKVNIADGAVYGNTKYYKNYGSFGETGQTVKVFYHDGVSASEVLSAPRGELGYRQSETGQTVTRREVVYAGGQIDTLRSQYDQTQNMKQNMPGKTDREFSLTVDQGLTFEQYVEQYFRSQGINLDEKVIARDGIITLNGMSALTVPWNQAFSIVDQNGNYLVKKTTPIAAGSGLTLQG